MEVTVSFKIISADILTTGDIVYVSSSGKTIKLEGYDGNVSYPYVSGITYQMRIYQAVVFVISLFCVQQIMKLYMFLTVIKSTR